ncbi:MAG: glycosyltransferase family 4 protein [Chloroflexi bacterium]|nr:glycosyltransferase family 4 protein [Chloroflexota bacterium]
MVDQPEGAILHYSLLPVVGGVERVIQAHSRLLAEHGHPHVMIAGSGGEGIPNLPGVSTWILPELDTRNPRVQEMSSGLEKGELPPGFAPFVDEIAARLRPALAPLKWVIVHNVFTKHFNLAFTAALARLASEGSLPRCIAWCHDITWTSQASRSKVFPGYPWDLLRTPISELVYVAISSQRQKELAGLFNYPVERLPVIHTGVDPVTLLGLSPGGRELCDRLGLFDSDLTLLMPVRVTQAKNIELALRLTAALVALGCRPRLVVTGPPDPHEARNMEYFRSLLELRRELGVEEQAHFVYESGPEPGKPFFIDDELLGDLYRTADFVFMPSHREGFGMPVVEAGLIGVPVICSDIPAAADVGGNDVTRIDPSQDPAELARILLGWAEGSSTCRLRRRIRQYYTWQAIYSREIEPLLE